jgi:hypothetical protein
LNNSHVAPKKNRTRDWNLNKRKNSGKNNIPQKKKKLRRLTRFIFLGPFLVALSIKSKAGLFFSSLPFSPPKIAGPLWDPICLAGREELAKEAEGAKEEEGGGGRATVLVQPPCRMVRTLLGFRRMM